MAKWQKKLGKLITTGDFSTQKELVLALSKKGFAVNQATVSRELQRIGARKINGSYQIRSSQLGGIPIHSFAVTSQGCLAVLKTNPAFASVVAHRIDSANLSGILGTIAGDDTVFVALTGAEAVPKLRSVFGLSDE